MTHRQAAVLAAAAGAFMIAALGGTAAAQQPGGVLRIAHRDSPASMSVLEEVTISVVAPMMPVFNNLVLFEQRVPQNSLNSIVPDLATDWRGGRTARNCPSTCARRCTGTTAGCSHQPTSNAPGT